MAYNRKYQPKSFEEVGHVLLQGMQALPVNVIND